METRRENASLYFMLAGLIFFMIAAGVVVFAPWMGMARKMEEVTNVEGRAVKAPQRTEAEKRGRQIYIREKCWLCHSQVVRGDWERTAQGLKLESRGGDAERYGPISQPGESAADTPHLYGTRRIGPDLARVGGKYPDAWHTMHFLNPQAVIPGSVMPKFVWLYTNIDYGRSGKPVKGDPTVELLDLISYVQSLGAGIGDWRRATAPQAAAAPHEAVSDAAQLASQGREIFGKADCSACHGPEGRGDGPAAAGFPSNHKPANFHSGKWIFGGDDKSVQETISKGRLPYMPAHPQYRPDEARALSAFIRSLAGKK